MARALQKYLARWAEPTALLAEQLTGTFAFGLAIPALAEGAGLVDTLRTVPAGRGAPLVVVVINRSEAASAEQVADNRATVEAIEAAWPAERALSDVASLHRFQDGALLRLDLVLPQKRAGVGLARKIGHDLLLAAWSRGQLASDWLYSTDADVQMPGDFFDPPGRSGAALLQPFTHVPVDVELADATWRYEARLRHHVLGLRWAQSPYAFHNIGSTIACDAESYAKVRGFPVRAAAEDFYLLSKLSKIGPIVERRGQPLRIAGRRSWRVPFGTGAAITKAVDGEDAPPPLCYHPEIFSLLRRALAEMTDAVRRGQSLPAAEDSRYMAGLRERTVAQLVDTINASGLAAGARQRRLVEGFDALQTLKLMHAWRNLGLADLPVEDALEMSPFCPAPPSDPTAVNEYLAALELGNAVAGE